MPEGIGVSMIDWSDPDEMLGLLVEYVRDELAAAHGDRERAAFLRSLRSALDALAARGRLSPRGALARLRRIAEAQPAAFIGDPASIHVRDCIVELERIVGRTRSD